MKPYPRSGPLQRRNHAAPIGAPVGVDVPVLVLAGEYDTARPPAEARRAAEPLSRSTVVEFPGAGHAVALAGVCPLDVMAQFLDDPASTPDTRSLEDGVAR